MGREEIEMDISEAMKHVTKALDEEIPHLRQSKYDNQEYYIWHKKMCKILETSFGKTSDEYKEFSHAAGYTEFSRNLPIQSDFKQSEYVRNLTKVETVLKSIMQNYEVLGVEEKSAAIIRPPIASRDSEGREMTLPENVDVVNELRTFFNELELYYDYRLRLRAKKRLKNSERQRMTELFYTIGHKSGWAAPLITELTGLDKVTIGKNKVDMWIIGLRYDFDSLTESAFQVCLQATTRAIGKLEADIRMGIRDKQGTSIEKLQRLSLEPPKAFIAHGGKTEARDKLCQFLTALGIIPLIVEEQPSEGRSVAENVDYYARQSDFAIILATKGDIDSKTGAFIPRGNVLMETGKLQEIFKDRIVYLLQAGTKFPTNISEKVRERFTSQNMDNAFIKIAKELNKFGILKTVKPRKEE